jgi:hypothetical protein
LELFQVKNEAPIISISHFASNVAYVSKNASLMQS